MEAIMKCDDQVTKFEALIEERHLDSFNHVNHAHYFEFFENARWDYLKNNGYGPELVDKTKLAPIIHEIQIKYLKELVLDEKISIHSKIKSCTGVRVYWEQTLFNSENVKSATAIFTLTLFNLETRKVARPTLQWLQAMKITPD